MNCFVYGDEEMEYLCRRDRRLAAAIREIGRIERRVQPDVFAAVIESIVAQQISGKAAVTVLGRLTALLGGRITHRAILEAKDADIQACGLSWRKVGYLRGAAEAADSGRLDCERLPGLSDQDIIAELVGLEGVGVWTAEMLLIFSLGRPDVVSYGDLAIRRGMMRLYGLKELPREKFERYRRRYSPHGSVASFYLWRLSGM